jgi:hypothetical protein
MRAPHLPCVALALALCPVVVWGCGSDGPVLPPPDAGRPRNETCLALPPPPDAGRVRLERVYATSLSGNAAQKLTHVILPGADHPGFVTRQSGRVMSFTAADDAAGTVVLDIASQLDLSSSENGLVSMALDPSFADQRLRLLRVHGAARRHGALCGARGALPLDRQRVR